MQDLCNAPIPPDEDSFDEAHHGNEEAVNFMVGETLIDLEMERSPTSSAKQKCASALVKASSEPPEQTKKAAPPRPAHPPLSRTSIQKPKGDDVSACEKLAAATVALSTILPAKPLAEDVKIDVEAEEQV